MYETETKWNEAELRKLNIVSILKVHHGYLVTVITFIVLLIVFGIWCMLSWNLYMGLFFILLAIGMPFAILLRITINSAISFNSNKIIQENSYRMRFEEGQFVVTSAKGENVIQYSDLYRVLESKTNFYLYLSRQQAYTAIKANCSNELIGFLHGLVK